MHATRKAFRSLRSFTHAARHHSNASEIISDPIVDDDNTPTPETRNLNRNYTGSTADDIVADIPTPVKSRHFSSSSPEHPSHLRSSDPLSLQEKDSNSNQVDSSNETRLYSFDLVSRHRSPSVLTELASTSPTPHNINSQDRAKYHPLQVKTLPNNAKLLRASPRDSLLPGQTQNLSSQTHREHHLSRKSTSNEQPLASTSLEKINRERPVQNKAQYVFDVEEIIGRPASPEVKRRRTRSTIRQNRPSSPSPEVDKLHYRQLLDNATEEGRRAILAASESSRRRRKRRHLVRGDEAHTKREEAILLNPLKDGDVQWLGTSYDSVEEVALTPSPQTKRKRYSDHPARDAHADRASGKASHTIIERIDTSESPERIMRRRSRRLSRDINRTSTGTNSGRQVETVDSSSSPRPKRRRSRRLARIAESPPPEEADGSDDSDNSEVSDEMVVEKAIDSKKTKKGKGVPRSRPLPKPKKGLLRERLRRRMPILPMKKKRSRNGKKKATPRVGDSTDQDCSAPRRSRRLRKSRAHTRPIVDVDAEDEVIEEGPADDENEGDGSDLEAEKDASKEEEELTVEEFGDDEDDEDGEIPFEDGEDDEEDGDHEEDEEDFEERAWREQLKLKQIRRKQKRNGRRKRTQPRDVFRTGGENLTKQEQKQRLNFLVEQSAEIAGHLHKAMGEAARDAGEGTKNGEGSVPNSTNGDIRHERSGGESDVLRRKETFASPSGSGCELQPHQKDGVDWLLTLDSQGLNAILADEMGLGKTIQAISFLASLVLSGSRGPHLVVAPKNVCQHWADEARKWYPTELTVVTHMGNLEDRLERLRPVLEEDNFDILVTSFDTALCDLFTRKRRDGVSWEHLQVLRAFRKVEFEYLVVDEAHRLKNDSTRTNRAIRGYDLAQRRLLLTGTPLSNDLQELWSLMNVLNPRIFSSKATFEAWFSAPFASKTKKRAKVSLTHAEQSVIVDRLHTVIRPFFRRRVRADICPTFTSADEVIIRCPLSALQRAVLLHFQRRSTTNECGIRNVLMAMRAATNHPYIVSDALFDSEQPLDPRRLVSSSGKFVFLHFALPRLINSGHRVLIFSQFKRVLDFIEDLLNMLDLKFARLDGETSNDERANGLTEFNREGSDIPVFLLTTRAGGIGLNLQSADTVILYDSDWNPSADLQAVSRIQRIGQKRTVHILRLVTEKSVDDLIVETARHKLRTQNVAVGAGKFNTSMGAALDTRRRQKDLEELLKRLEVQNYAEDQDEATEGASQENSSPESLSPRRVSRTAQNCRFIEWGNQLLRKGESSLSSVDIVPIWIDNASDSSDSSIPPWLNKDADLGSAVKALDCPDMYSATRIYEESIFLKTEAGRLSKKDRAMRARRQTSVMEISDVDSEKDTERSDDVDWVENSESESEDYIPEEQTASEKQSPKKTGRNGLYQIWAKNQVNGVPPRPVDPVPVASLLTGSSQPCRLPNPIQQVVSYGVTGVQSVPTQDGNNTHGVVHINREANLSTGRVSNVWGPHLSSDCERSGSSQQRVAFPAAHLKRIPPGNHASSSMLTVSKGKTKKNNVTVGRSYVKNGPSSGGIRNEWQAVPTVAQSQQEALRNHNLFPRNVPSGDIRFNFRGSRDAITTLAHKPVRQSMLAPASVLPPHIGLSAKGAASAIPCVGQGFIATALPAGSQWSSHVSMPVSGNFPGSNYLHVQEGKRPGNGTAANPARPLGCAVQPTPMRTSVEVRVTAAKWVKNPAPSKWSASKKDNSREPIVVASGEVEIASPDDFSVTFWQENIGAATEETVSVRSPSKQALSPSKNYGQVATVTDHAKRFSDGKTEIRNQRRNLKPSINLPVDATTTAVPSAKPINADQFAASVERLKGMTNVLDTQFLEDALLDCGYNIEAAKEMVLQQIR